MPAHLDLIERHQRHLLDIATTVRPLNNVALHEADLDALHFLRREMLAALDLYHALLKKYEGDARHTGDDRRLAYIAALQANHRAITLLYDAFRARWAERTVVENWSEYRLSSAHMLRNAHQLIVRAMELDAGLPGDVL